MATYRHDPKGEWFAVVRGGAILLVPAAMSGVLGELWTVFDDGDPTSEVLDRLTAKGLAATPPFALVVRDVGAASARVVVRGPITIDAGGVQVRGADVATWTERVIDGAAVVLVEVDASAAVDGVSLPLIEGVVPAVAVSSERVERVERVERAVGVQRAEGVEVVEPDEGAERAEVEATRALPTRTITTVPIPPTPTPTASAFPAFPPPPSMPPSAPLPHVPAEQTMIPADETVASAPSGARTGAAAPVAAFEAASNVALDGDHDGMTVASVDIKQLREARAARAEAPTPSGVPAASAAPSPISIRMPDGSLEPIGQEVVLGRAPSVSKISGGRIPRLVTIGLGDPDISRSHVRLGLEGDTVVVTDLHSRNGTHVAQPGKAPVKLRAGEPTPVLAGTVVDLGGGWTIQVVAD